MRGWWKKHRICGGTGRATDYSRRVHVGATGFVIWMRNSAVERYCRGQKNGGVWKGMSKGTLIGQDDRSFEIEKGKRKRQAN